MSLGFRLQAERTPNPDCSKWTVGEPLVHGQETARFSERPSHEVSPLAARLFDIDGVVGVFFASNFASVTKREDVEWTDIAESIADAFKECVGAGGSALGPAFLASDDSAGDGVVARIRRILDEEIRPAVAMDGGDIIFAGFRDGIVEVYMQGACSGCPGATATLKQGVEARLREEIPEVEGVIAL
jgi:Fe-S cluster biogenesis protein NfuA